MVALGRLALYLALAASVWGAVAALVGARSGREDAVRSGEGAVKAAAVCLTVAALALFYAFLSRDFSLEYVASYSSRSLSNFYTLSAFWAGQPGSLLLWAWVLSLYGALVVYQNRARNRDLMPYVVAVLGVVIALFTFMIVFESNPFKSLPAPVADGQGLNPLLQNYGQFFHPVTLYMGYVGFTIPFAFCIAALATGKLGEVWVTTVRKWTLWAWVALTAGILFGMRWAYVELGWGGYWAWDPVENASLLPWLAATAYLHSVMIQEKKGMLKVWNVSLAVAAFALSIFGTFLTRSGVISSVHAFAESNIGPFLIGATIMVVAISGALIVWRLPELRSVAVMESMASREASFLLNNLLLVGMAFAIFWGTVFPLVAQAVRGTKLSVGPPFFEAVVTPMGVALLALVGFCPLLAWRKASLKNLRRNFIMPLSVLVGSAVVLTAATRGTHLGLVTVLAFSAFVTATIAAEFYRGARTRRRVRGEGWGTALIGLFVKNPRRHGGYLIHFGVVVMLVGVGVHVAYKTEHRASMTVGQSVRMRGYVLTLEDLRDEMTPAKLSTVAILRMSSPGGKNLGTIRAERNVFFTSQDQPTSEVGIKSSPKEDLYVILESGDSAQRVASLRFLINPGVFWVWAGAVIILAGGIIVAWPQRRRAGLGAPPKGGAVTEVSREAASAHAPA